MSGDGGVWRWVNGDGGVAVKRDQRWKKEAKIKDPYQYQPHPRLQGKRGEKQQSIADVAKLHFPTEPTQNNGGSEEMGEWRWGSGDR